MMNKRNLKLIMELIFIFILPLVFICFTSEIHVEREFTYDNNGNYETSQDTKQLSFDNSIIKYTKQKTITNQSLEFKYFENDELINIIYEPQEIWHDTPYDILYGNEKGEGTIWLQAYENNKLYYEYDYNGYAGYGFLNYSEIYENNNINYYKFELNNIQLPNNNIILDINEGYYYLETTTETITTNTIWGTIKELLIDNLELNNNVLLDIILCYMILWLIQWIIWHLFYGLLELLWHVIPSPIERRI